MGLLDILMPYKPGTTGLGPNRPDQNPFTNWFDLNRNKIVGGFAGMAGAGNDPRMAIQGLSQGVLSGIPADSAYGQVLQKKAEEDKAAQQAQQQQTATVKWLMDNGHPEWAQAVQMGGVTGADALKNVLGGANNQAQYSLTPVWGTDKDGNPVMGQMSNAGGVQVVKPPDGVQFGKEPIRIDAGDRFILLDPVTRQPIGQIPKSGNVPEGFQPSPQGGIQPMQGSPQQLEQNAKLAQANSAMTTLEAKNQIVVNKIDQALNQANWMTTGFLGGLSAGAGGTPAYDLAETLKTIKANIGFDELQKMRDASPTGGALGAISDREIAFLQSTITSIEQSQSEDQLKANLKLLRDYLVMSQAQRRKAFSDTFGGGAPSAPAVPPTGGDPELDQLLRQYGN